MTELSTRIDDLRVEIRSTVTGSYFVYITNRASGWAMVLNRETFGKIQTMVETFKQINGV